MIDLDAILARHAAHLRARRLGTGDAAELAAELAAASAADVPELVAAVAELSDRLALADPLTHPAYVLNIAAHDDYLYLECGECDDIVCGIEEGDSLPDLLRRAREHHAAWHADEAPPPRLVDAEIGRVLR